MSGALATAAAVGDTLEFYLIGELARETGTNCTAIRFYEREGFITPRRHGRMRVYSPGDAERLNFVLALRALGVPLKTIRGLLGKLPETGDWLASAPVLEALKEHREELVRQRDTVPVSSIPSQSGSPAAEKTIRRQAGTASHLFSQSQLPLTVRSGSHAAGDKLSDGGRGLRWRHADTAAGPRCYEATVVFKRFFEAFFAGFRGDFGCL